MEHSNCVSSIKEFVDWAWQTSPPQDAEVTLFRGQPNNHSLLPKLFRSPNTVHEVQQNEGKMLSFLQQAAPHLAPSRPTNDWDWLSLAQHYGMSTRMSDWSANPLVALFFAVELNPASETNPTVYRYPIEAEIIEDKKEDSPLMIPHTKVIKPTHSHRSTFRQLGK